MTLPRITGWKHRRALSLLVLRNWPWAGVTALTQTMAQAHINLPFLLVQASKAGARGSLCLEQDLRPQAEAMAADLAREQSWSTLEVTEPVAALTLYPLAGGMGLPAQALACLARAGLRPLALGTSLATMTVILPEGVLPPTVEALRRCFELPPGASPPEERVKVVQSPVRRGS